MAANRRFLTCCIVLSLLLSGIHCVESAEVGNDRTSTHGTEQDEHGGSTAGARPPTTAGLTPQERQQLLQIEQTIRQASNPREAIQQIAEANQMSQEDLVQLLNQNRQELEQQQQGSRGSLQGGSLASTIARFVTSMGVMVQHFAKQNPKQFSLIVSASLLMIYVVITAPRTGMVLSTSRGLLSKGHTTVFSPPTRYVNRWLESTSLTRRPLSSPVASLEPKSWIADLENDLRDKKSKKKRVRVDAGSRVHDSLAVQWHSKIRKSSIKEAATARVTLLLEDFLPSGLSTSEEDDNNNGDDEETEAVDEESGAKEQQEFVRDLLWESVLQTVDSRRWTDFVPSPSKLRFQSRQRHGVLVVPRAGDWRLYGLVPFKVTRQHETERDAEVVLSTLRGALLDGLLRLTVRQASHGKAVVVGVDLVSPKRGKRIPKRLATQIVVGLSQSVATSVETEARKRLARRGQGARFQQRARAHASERRQFRAEKERQLEDMAADRRRRRHQRNPDAGRYRPSGHRQRSPNNC